jgi:hypothetical protein
MIRSRLFKNNSKRKPQKSTADCSSIRFSSHRLGMIARRGAGVSSRPFEPSPSMRWSSTAPGSPLWTVAVFTWPSRKGDAEASRPCLCSWSARHEISWCVPRPSRDGRSCRRRTFVQVIPESRHGRSSFFEHGCRRLHLPWQKRSLVWFMPIGTWRPSCRRRLPARLSSLPLLLP